MKKIFVYGDKETYINYAKALECFDVNVVFSTDIKISRGCQALLLVGGGDIAPSLYRHQNVESKNIDLQRDISEITLVHEYINTKRPILGICKGMQILNVALGGTINQDIKTTVAHKWDGNDKIHNICVCKNSFLSPIYGCEFPVNSAHHQAVYDIANCLCPTGHSRDGVVEVLENNDCKVFGLQWHPERMCLNYRNPNTVDGLEIFEFFINKI